MLIFPGKPELPLQTAPLPSCAEKMQDQYPTQKAQYHILLCTKYTPSHNGGDGVFVNRVVDIAI